MPTNINQTRDELRGITVLRIDGDMFLDDAVLIEKIANCIRQENGDVVSIDIADLDLLDSEAAPILKRIGERNGFKIDGMEIFRQSIVDTAERGVS